ncbi:bifunctional helix-turn-helix domain-containing protein/methylated-DNA--[protein]-cysteine S-methyltransferase [Rhabdobacter roseus]|uniref:methylated-DNA--[protein]-cysteine S-methyltransferase n=1 Tax=Rhabdobacter roseus TaxID=1655419 RepID=A0A840TJU4_9BACT|nr:methylated-DNA--[protein]-cysteine S-methyltransferase [Rhabdobacter roseus]MBB5282067.1 AraC family transcriptional regulator of adaptative response/methylated-DNA-[protein]-cysteine methyltransferase [Rhabdobacter roseus]
MEEAISQTTLDYQRIEQAIRYIEANYRHQPSLRDIADHVALSEYHFSRMFSRWAGTSPQRFMKYLTKEYAKAQLAQTGSLLDATYATGLSSPSRLHDLFVTYEAMTPAEFRAQGAGVPIRYGLHATPFGECFIALSPRGITDIRFLTGPETAEVFVAQLRAEWPQAGYLPDSAATQPYAERLFNAGTSEASQPLPLLLRGTNFQIKVWEALLRIPFGRLVSYDDVARYIGQPTASRAVGTAIGSNRLAYLIPCHRVLQKAGGLGGYRWGTARKQALLGWEAAQSQPEVPWEGTWAQTQIEF